MEPIYDSESQAENEKQNRKMMDNGEEYSSDDEEPSFMKKVGGFLFFGCGNSKDATKKWLTW